MTREFIRPITAEVLANNAATAPLNCTTDETELLPLKVASKCDCEPNAVSAFPKFCGQETIVWNCRFLPGFERHGQRYGPRTLNMCSPAEDVAFSLDLTCEWPALQRCCLVMQCQVRDAPNANLAISQTHPSRE